MKIPYYIYTATYVLNSKQLYSYKLWLYWACGYMRKACLSSIDLFRFGRSFLVPIQTTLKPLKPSIAGSKRSVYEAIASRIRRTLNAQRAAKKIRDATSWILWVNHGTRLTKHLKICTRMVTTLSHVENFSYCKRYCLNCTFKMLSCLLMCFMCTENDKFCSFFTVFKHRLNWVVILYNVV